MGKGCRRQATKHNGPGPWPPSPPDLSSTASTIRAGRRAPQTRIGAASTTPTAQPRPHSPDPRPLAAGDVATGIALVRPILNETLDPRGPVVEAYRRSCQPGLSEDLSNRVLCFHRALTFNGAVVPGLVALLGNVVTRGPCGRERTFLDRDQSRLARRMLGRGQRAAIKLHANDAVTLGPLISTRLETGLAWCRPVWALASVGANAGVSGLHAIETISILPGCTHDAGSRRATQAKSWLPGGPDAFVIAFAGDAANLACKVA
jgi:hypothetical protein